MTDEQIVEAAKKAEQKTGFGELVHSQISRGVNSAFGIGFLEGAEWAREQRNDKIKAFIKDLAHCCVVTAIASAIMFCLWYYFF